MRKCISVISLIIRGYVWLRGLQDTLAEWGVVVFNGDEGMRVVYSEFVAFILGVGGWGVCTAELGVCGLFIIFHILLFISC